MNFLNDIYNLFFPKTCVICENSLVKNEEVLCIKCNFDLPLTEITEIPNNFVEDTFFGRIPLEFASSLLLYKRKNIVQKIMHELKYRDREDIGAFFGKRFGNELVNSERFPKIDYVIPVPLHARKLKSRGYNQIAKFAQEISKSINAAYLDDCLKCVITSETQTLKQRLERWKNVESKFLLIDKNIFKNKSILLVDDVITTGATLEACALEFVGIENVKISIATLAFTS